MRSCIINEFSYIINVGSTYTYLKGVSLKSTSCNPGVRYIGSHDAFVFFSDRQFLGKDLLTDLSTVSQTSDGMENVMIWYFRTVLGFKVINPCPHVKIYHQHRVPIRNKIRKRINRGRNSGKNGLAPFTDKLL